MSFLSILKRFLFSLTAILLVFILVLAILEIVFRISGDKTATPLYQITQKDSHFLFEPNSTFVAKSLERDMSYTVHLNKYGYRGANFEIPKKPGTTRVFMVGDSFTFGTGEQDNETIPYLLEQKLRSQGIDVEIVNAGIGHTSPITHYVNLRDLHLKYQPDLVVVLFDLTDLWDDWHWERGAIFDKNNEPVRFDTNYIYGKRDWWRTCTSYSVACRFINNKHVRTYKKIKALGVKKYLQVLFSGGKAKAAIINSQKGTQSDEVLIEYDGLLLLRGQEKKDLILKNWPRTTKYLLKIKDLLERNGIRYVIAMYPHGIYVGPDQWSKGRASWGFPTNTVSKDYLPFELMRDFTKANNIPFVNSLDDFLKAPPKKYFFDYDGHLTPDGNHIVVENFLHDPGFRKVLKDQVEQDQHSAVKP